MHKQGFRHHLTNGLLIGLAAGPGGLLFANGVFYASKFGGAVGLSAYLVLMSGLIYASVMMVWERRKQ